MLEDLLSIVDAAEAGRFRTDQASAVGEALAGQNAIVKAVADSSVLAEQEADFSSADADVTGRHVGVRSDMTLQFGHE